MGAILLKRMLDGVQDVTITDSARGAMNAMWTRLGGFAVPIGCLAWVRPLRPAGLAWALLKHRFGRGVAPRRVRSAVDGRRRPQVDFGSMRPA